MHTREALVGLLFSKSARPILRAPVICCKKNTHSYLHARPANILQLSLRAFSGAATNTVSGSTPNSNGVSVPTMPPTPVSLHWFRKGLRLHDNRALLEACDEAEALYPLFIMDPDPASPESRAGNLRMAFLLESLKDLDEQLRLKGSRLFVTRGKPEQVLPGIFYEWGVTKLTFEADFEPRSLQRDAEVRKLAQEAGVQVAVRGTSTLRDLERYKGLMGKKEGTYMKSYSAFLKLHENAGLVRMCVPDISGDLPPPGVSPESVEYDRFSIPSFADMGMQPPTKALKFKGGEREALSRLEGVLARKTWISKFEKPQTSPNSIDPSTTVLSMYISHGCLSTRRFWHALCKVYNEKGGSKPPVSLKGQLLWKEFNYFSGYTIPNFDKMAGNPVVRQIPWANDQEKLTAWKEARTGFPFIDAIMTQLRDEGWIHHLARHAVACFLTRGDLWQSWEDGAAVFDELLLDADWSINNFNWQWLSCSAFFYQYFRCYSPVAFGKKTDKNGDYIRKYVPVLKHYPSKYIYEPWTAPLLVQQGCRCIIGKDYPKPIVDHKDVSKENMGKMHDAYEAFNNNTSNNSNSNQVAVPTPAAEEGRGGRNEGSGGVYSIFKNGRGRGGGGGSSEKEAPPKRSKR